MGVERMTNKEKLKRAIEQEMNPKEYYKEIINKIEKGEKRKMKNKIEKWAFVPIGLVIVVSGILFFHQNDKKEVLENKPYVDKETNITLNINEVTNKNGGTYSIDAELKRVTNHDVAFPLPYKEERINIPKDLEKTYKYILYFRENRESKEYNIIGNYEIVYSNDNDRTINIKYSKDRKPIRDYYFNEEGRKTTTINGIELKIFKYEETYFTEFQWNDYNFDIETTKITEQELSTFLLAMLK